MTAVVRKASVFERLNHWVMALSFLLLAVTGSGFLYHLEGLNSLFGNFQNVRTIHNYVGVVFSSSLFLSLFSYLGEALLFDADDRAWLSSFGGYLSKKKKRVPQGRLNAGQKLFYIFLVIIGATLSVTGFIIWLLPAAKDRVLLSHFVHTACFVLLITAVPLHIYLGSLANPGTFRIMIYGTVPIEWAKRRHAKWAAKQQI